MPDNVKLAFDATIVSVPIEMVLPRHLIPENILKGVKYQRIAASVAEVGVIEPVVVSPLKDQAGIYMLLDGHLRLNALRDLGVSMVACIVASDDEGFTYNKRINHLATIQEHFMIVAALKGGASREKLAVSLNMDIRRIEQRRTMLDGICPEVVELLKERPNINTGIFKVLKKMKPARQISVVGLMLSVNNLTNSYAQALLAGTRAADLKDGPKGKQMSGLTPEQMARIEREAETLQVDFKAVESRHGDDVLNLMIACGYLAKLLRNSAVERYIAKRDADLVEQLRAIIAATSPDREWVQA